MEDERAQTFIAALRELENEQTSDALVALFDDHSTLDNMTATTGLQGQDGARQFWTQDRTIFSKVSSEFHGVYADGDVVVLEWTRTGTGRDGGKVDYDGVSVIEYRDDRILRFKAYFDPNLVGRQAL